MVSLHDQLNEHGFEQTLGGRGGQKNLVCYKESGKTQRLSHSNNL